MITIIKTLWNDYKKLSLTDPVKSCNLYRNEGCSHVDGFLCNMETCSCKKRYDEEETNDN